MKKVLLTLALVACAPMAQAMEVGAALGMLSAMACSSVATVASHKSMNNKIIVGAQEDAYVFVATDGEIRGAQLEQALQLIHTEDPNSTASDMDLAIAIINY